MANENRSVVSTIRSKLVAAIAMLLVGVFMVISSSYAWFTLSTAPEVTGIYTSVGANGNLEMALVPADGNLANITSGVGDSGKNESWGNLVDLGQSVDNQNKYGLDKIQLLPARLNVTGTDSYKFNGLSAPTYGADGRVDALTTVSSGKYEDGSWKVGTANGVSALGMASGMSEQQTAWMQYKRSVNSTLADAQNAADATFKDYGTPLANVVMNRAMNGTEGVEFDIHFVGDMVADLEVANAKLAEAAEWYFAAKAAEVLFNNDEAWALVASKISTLDFASLDPAATSVTIEGNEIPFDTTLTKVMAQYNEIKTKLNATKTAWNTYANPTDGEAPDTTKATWTQANAILIATGFLVYDEQITVNGKTTDEIKSMMGEDFSMDEIPQELMDFGLAFVQNGTVDFTSGSGVHADFAEIVGEYQEEISVTMSLNGSAFTNNNVKLRTKIDTDGERIDMYALLTNQPADNNSATTVKLITDFYGYMLDFAFRTNAQGSDLMLQTSPVGRIYATEGSDTTMGHGSTMTFAIEDTTFTLAQAKNLMSAVRIVFLDDAQNIVAIGLLAQPTGGTFTETDHVVSANNEISSSIYLYNFSFAADGKLVVGEKIEATEGKTALMALGQNTATKLSVLVYLDGDVVDNSMVAAEKVASLKGSLNLQFSSSADLLPMDYADFQGNGEEATE